MAKIEITLPTVQYGNAKVSGEFEEFGLDATSPHDVGVAVAVFLNLFTQGFQAGSKIDVGPLTFKDADDADAVAAHEIASQLGATEVDDSAEDVRTGDEYTAPWKQKPKASVKEWERVEKDPAPAVDDEW